MTFGIGLIVIEKFVGVPVQVTPAFVASGVTVIFPTMCWFWFADKFDAVKEGIVPWLAAPKPIS